MRRQGKGLFVVALLVWIHVIQVCGAISQEAHTTRRWQRDSDGASPNTDSPEEQALERQSLAEASTDPTPGQARDSLEEQALQRQTLSGRAGASGDSEEEVRLEQESLRGEPPVDVDASQEGQQGGGSEWETDDMRFRTGLFGGLVSKAKSFFNKAKSHVSNAVNTVKGHATNLFNKAKTHVGNVFNKVKGHATNLINKVKTHAGNVWNAVKNTAGNLIAGAKKMLGGPALAALAGAGLGLVAGSIDPGKLFGGFKPTTPQQPPKPFPTADLIKARQLDPNFDKIDWPEMCEERCNGRGKCLIDRDEIVVVGLVRMHPYKCRCHPDWAGERCQTRVDQLVRWFESMGTTPFPRCCNVCPSQFRAPSKYSKLPVYQNPYSVGYGDCDPSVSLDSRPTWRKPNCWRPLSYQPEVQPNELDFEDTFEMGELIAQNNQEAAAASFVEQQASRRDTPEQQQQQQPEQQEQQQEQQQRQQQQQQQPQGEEPPLTGDARQQFVDDADAERFRTGLLGNIIGGVVNAVKNVASGVHNAVKNVASGVHGAIKGAIGHVKNALGFGNKEDKAAKAREAEAKAEWQKRVAHPVAECCIFCDFDFWAQANSGATRPRHGGRGLNYLRALERQRVMERMSGETVMRELRRRQIISDTAQQAMKIALESKVVKDAFGLQQQLQQKKSFLELAEVHEKLDRNRRVLSALRGLKRRVMQRHRRKGSPRAADTPRFASAKTQQQQGGRESMAARADLDTAQGQEFFFSTIKKLFGGGGSKKAQEQKAATFSNDQAKRVKEAQAAAGVSTQENDNKPGVCCNVCPIPAQGAMVPRTNPFSPTEEELQHQKDQEAAQQKKETVDRKKAKDEIRNGGLGSHLYTRWRAKLNWRCCDSCPSQFWLRTVAPYKGPFDGKPPMEEQEIVPEPEGGATPESQAAEQHQGPPMTGDGQEVMGPGSPEWQGATSAMANDLEQANAHQFQQDNAPATEQAEA